MIAALRRHWSARFEEWVTRSHRRLPGPGAIPRRRLYILPTRAGMGFAMLLIAMLLGATNYSNNLAFALTFLLGGIGLVCMHHTHSNLLNLKVTVGRAQPVFAGETAWVPVAIGNPSPLHRYSLLVARRRDRIQYQAAVDCPPHGHCDTGFPLPSERRGWLPVPRFTVATEFPLGLFHAWTWLNIDANCLVYPRPAPGGRPIPPALGGSGASHGERSGQDDFAGLREYQLGDSIRRVHWKSYSHTGELMTKMFAEPLDETLWLDWKLLDEIRDVEQRLSQLCRWVLDCEERNELYGLRLPDEEIPPGNGDAHRERCLHALATYGLATA